MKSERPIIVSDLAYGDAGKGTTVDALARTFGATTAIRYNGGPQAWHNVVTPEGVWHGFAQIGSASLTTGARTILSRFMLVDPARLAVEAAVLKEKTHEDVLSTITVDPRCLIITPAHVLVGRMREIARGDKRHGSCGMGISETVLDDEAGARVRVEDIIQGRQGINKLEEIARAKLAQAQELLKASPSMELAAVLQELRELSDEEALYYRYRLTLECVTIMPDAEAIDRDRREERALIFEGAQGALLDRWRGFVPHVTKSDTTQANARTLLQEAGVRERPFTLGVLRAYGHRHGAGPFVTEDPSVAERFADPYNTTNRWQGAFRVGWLDLPALRYGMSMNGNVDALCLTGLDQLSLLKQIPVCVAYRDPAGHRLLHIPHTASPEERTALVSVCTPEWIQWAGWNEPLRAVRSWNHLPDAAQTFVRFLESSQGLGKPIALLSVGPTHEHKIFR